MGPERRLRLFIYARILVAFLFLVSTIAVNLNEPKAIDDPSYAGMIRLVVFSFLFSVFSHFSLRIRRFRPFITYLQTIWDLLFATVLLLLTGGVTSPYSFLYLLSIMSAGLMLGRREAFHTASLCGILYGAIVDFQFFGLLAPIGLSQVAAQQLGEMRLIYSIFLNLMGFFLAALITGHLSALARESEEALLAKSINYDELERLSSTIVSNVESGLLTITPEGRIRVFNRYAEELTGKSQADVYDLPLREVMPAMAGVVENVTMASNGEFVCEGPGGGGMILGYSAVPFTDMHGDSAGVIMNFKDLTSIKQMEHALKRRDRLATLGELSARLAHEIRNPLAAMTGSVQLLAEHGSIVESDQRLLTIILREADRLNLLINEFLHYARPASPRKERIELRELVEDLRLLLASDQRFSGIVIVNLVPPNLVVEADENQLRQVLINLLHNAAEASPRDGSVEIEAAVQTGGLDGCEGAPVVRVSVTDSGAGISDEALLHLFEPFWTTKPLGTGLGLAIIYRIIEGHGGSITVESPLSGGCRFTILLPG
jgi:two-component system sensor histidine kinase PilS (NtrC family)